MNRDEILMTAAGLVLAVLLVLGFRRIVLPEIGSSDGVELYPPGSLIPAGYLRVVGGSSAPPLTSASADKNRQPAKSCGCFF